MGATTLSRIIRPDTIMPYPSNIQIPARFSSGEDTRRSPDPMAIVLRSKSVFIMGEKAAGPPYGPYPHSKIPCPQFVRLLSSTTVLTESAKSTDWPRVLVNVLCATVSFNSAAVRTTMDVESGITVHGSARVKVLPLRLFSKECCPTPVPKTIEMLMDSGL